jgi:hypothetical protein
MPLHDVSRTSSYGPVVPDCANCHRPDRVRMVKLNGVSAGVQYWRCNECGFVWAHATAKTSGRRVPHNAAPSPPAGDIMLERLVMLIAVVLIALGFATAFF